MKYKMSQKEAVKNNENRLNCSANLSPDIMSFNILIIKYITRQERRIILRKATLKKFNSHENKIIKTSSEKIIFSSDINIPASLYFSCTW
jgi:hypothetical protein